MKIENKAVGSFIPYEVEGTTVTFDNKLSLNLAGYQRDDETHLDICRDKSGNLVCGVIPGVAEIYVAQIDIPAKGYTVAAVEGEAAQTEGEEDDPMNMPNATREVEPFNMDDCVLTLWPIS